jgi:hypothetical protein
VLAHLLWGQEAKMAKVKSQPKPETVADRIARMLPIYEALNAETNRLIDQYIDEVAAPRCPGIPRAVLRGLEINNCVGSTMNHVEALKFLLRVKAP